MKRELPIVAVVAPALLVVGAVAFFFLVKPNMDESGALEETIAEFQGKVDTALAQQRRPEPEAIRVADVFRLTKAMPDSTDMASLILELKSVADAAGVSFDSITPAAPAPREGGYQVVPIALQFSGDYYVLTDFLFRLRNLVIVRDGELAAHGRLFTLESLSLQEGEAGFPDIVAGLSLSAFVYDAEAVAAAAAAAAATTPPATETTPADPAQEIPPG